MSEAHILARLHKQLSSISVQAETLEMQQCASTRTKPTAYSSLAGCHHLYKTAEACLDSKHETKCVHILCPYLGSSTLQMAELVLPM